MLHASHHRPRVARRRALRPAPGTAASRPCSAPRDDYHVRGSRASREGLRPQLQRPFRFRVVGRPPLGRQGIAEQDSHGAQRENRRYPPGGNHAPGVPGARQRDSLRRDLHVGDPLSSCAACFNAPRLMRLPRARGDRQRRHGADATSAAPTQTAGTSPSTNVCAVLVAAVVGEDRGEHGHAEDAAELADGVVRAGRLALLIAAAPSRARRSRPARRTAHADAAEDEGADELRVRRRRRRDAAIQPSPMACSASPTPMSRRPLMRSESAPAIGATKIGIAVQGRMRRPA